MLIEGKNEIKKRQTSPLTNNSDPLCLNLNNKGEQKRDLTKKCKQDNYIYSTELQSVSTTLTYDFNRWYQNRAFNNSNKYLLECRNRQIKPNLQTVEKIENTLNAINAKVSDLGTKIKSLDMRITENEKLCQFTAAESKSN